MPRLVLAAVLWFPSAVLAAGIVLVLGDSISAGYGLPRDAGWVHLLAQRLAREQQDYRVVNASLSGETTLGGRNRIGPLLEKHAPAVVVLELGGNDGLRGTAIESLRANLEAIVRACKHYRARVLLVGMRLPPNYGRTYVRRFDEAYSSVAAAEGIAFVPFIFEGFAERREMFQPDGIHPTAAAQPHILDTVWNTLRPLLESARTTSTRR